MGRLLNQEGVRIEQEICRISRPLEQEEGRYLAEDPRAMDLRNADRCCHILDTWTPRSGSGRKEGDNGTLVSSSLMSSIVVHRSGVAPRKPCY